MSETIIALPPQCEGADWATSLAGGAPGIALLHMELAHCGLGSWRTVHEWASAMTRLPVTAVPETASLFECAPAVAYALHAADRPGYTAALTALDSPIDVLIHHRLAAAHNRIDNGRLPRMREYDLISGLTGLGAYLMRRDGGGPLLRSVLAYLVRLACEPLTQHGNTILPGWWTSDGPSGRPDHEYPGGHANFGIAHGITGPLALLSTALRRNITVPGQPDAIDRVCAWLERWSCGTGRTAWWPEVITRNDLATAAATPAGPGRPSWSHP